MITTAALVIMFLFGAGIVLAVGSLLRDLSSQRYNYVDRRLGIDANTSDIENYYRHQDVHNGPVDQWFYQTVRESGSDIDVPTALAFCLGGGLIGAVLAFIVAESFLATALGLLLGIAIPVAWIIFRRWRRISIMRNQLPEALQIIADNVRAGHSLEQASEIVAAELSDPLASEFHECNSQLKLGNSPTTVMQRMADRVPLPEFRVFVTAAMVHQTAGGNLPLLIERLSHVARQRQEFTGYVNAVTAGSRLSAIGLVIGSIIAFAALAWLEPDYISAFVNHSLGPALLTLAIVLQIIGIIWIWCLIRVSY